MALVQVFEATGQLVHERRVGLLRLVPLEKREVTLCDVPAASLIALVRSLALKRPSV